MVNRFCNLVSWKINHYTPNFNEVERRSILVSPCPSVNLSVCGQNLVLSVSSTILIRSISYVHILSSNFRRCVACNRCFKIQKSWGSGGYPQNAGILFVLVFIEISLIFTLCISNCVKSASFWIMAWPYTEDKPLTKSMKNPETSLSYQTTIFQYLYHTFVTLLKKIILVKSINIEPQQNSYFSIGCKNSRQERITCRMSMKPNQNKTSTACIILVIHCSIDYIGPISNALPAGSPWIFDGPLLSSVKHTFCLCQGSISQTAYQLIIEVFWKLFLL